MTEEEKPKPKPSSAGRVAIILSLGLVIALNIIVTALMYAAYQRLGIDEDSGISDNGVQILLAWGGGIISVIAGYVGYSVGQRKTNGTPTPQSPTSETPPSHSDDRIE